MGSYVVQRPPILIKYNSHKFYSKLSDIESSQTSGQCPSAAMQWVITPQANTGCLYIGLTPEGDVHMWEGRVEVQQEHFSTVLEESFAPH